MPGPEPHTATVTLSTKCFLAMLSVCDTATQIRNATPLHRHSALRTHVDRLESHVPELVRIAGRLAREVTGRSEDAVRCPACGNGPGTSCAETASHPERRAAYVTQIARASES